MLRGRVDAAWGASYLERGRVVDFDGIRRGMRCAAGAPSVVVK